MTTIYTVTYCMLCHEVIEVNSSDEEQHIASYSRSGQDLTVSCENKVRRQQDKFRGFQKQRDTSTSYLRHFKTASNYKTTMQSMFLLYFHEQTDPRRPKAFEMVSLGNDNELYCYLYMLHYIFTCLPILAILF